MSPKEKIQSYTWSTIVNLKIANSIQIYDLFTKYTPPFYSTSSTTVYQIEHQTATQNAYLIVTVEWLKHIVEELVFTISKHHNNVVTGVCAQNELLS